jgi:uncharacterized protein YprB with RNaseH-like and TPR domain
MAKQRMTALTSYLRHLPYIDAACERTLREEGCNDWADILHAPHAVGGLDWVQWSELRSAAESSRHALDAGDAAYFVSRLPATEQWRVLAQWFDRATFFDIETSGLEADSIVTLVCCYHDGQPLSFLADDNLEAFLPLLESVRLLVSFNGASFDVPRVLDRFHIPELPCPHIDLRGLCRHVGWQGGLKKIEREQGLRRPPDLDGLGGAEAVQLWRAWSERGDEKARRTLVRYCSADTAMLASLAAKICIRHGALIPEPSEADLWERIRAVFPDLGRPEGLVPSQPLEPPPPKPIPPPVVSADRFSIAEMVRSTEGLSRAEKQARLRERWRRHQGL